MPKVNVFDKVVKVRRSDGSPVNQKEYTVVASTTILPGDIVVLNAGSVEQALAVNANANSLTTSSNTSVTGIALAGIVTNSGAAEAATGRTTIPVAILDGETEVAMRFYNATAGDSELQDVTVGSTYAFVRWSGAGGNANTAWYAASTSTTNPTFVLVEKSQDSAPSDDYGIGWFSATPARRSPLV